MQPKEIIKIGQLEIHILLDGTDTNNQMVLFEFIIPSGAKVPVPHYHLEVDETLYGLEGTTTSIVDGVKIDIGPGDRLYIPRGAVHYHDNHTASVAKVLCILAPASISPAYFKEIGELVQPGIPPDPAKATAIMLKHGLVPAAVKMQGGDR